MSHRFFPRHGRARRAWLGGLAALAGAASLLLAQVPASALDVGGTPSPVTGNATWFSGLGSPYGGCGLPQANLDTQNFLALNVQNSPGNYTNLPRPIPAADASETGMFDNGLNCGRWVQVTIGNYCTGVNDGAPSPSPTTGSPSPSPTPTNLPGACALTASIVNSWLADPSPGAWLSAAVTRCCPGYLVLSRERPIRYLNCHSGFPVQGGPTTAGHCISVTFPGAYLPGCE